MSSRKCDRNPDTETLLLLYDAGARRKVTCILLGTVAMLLMGLVFTTVGEGQVGLSQVLRAMGHWISGDLQDTQEKVIVFLRLPRIAMAIFAGIGLSAAGVVMQSITRNPMASPFTGGISNAAAFGASVSIVFGIGYRPGTELGTVVNAFVLSIGCALLVYFVSIKVGMTPETIVLVGIALSYLFGAATSTIEFFANEHQLAAVIQWDFGSLNGVKWKETVVVGVFTLLSSGIIYGFAPALNIMISGDDQVAKSLGIRVSLVRGTTGLLAVLATASVISFTGVIGFVGLAGPHIARMLIGNDHRYLLPFSAVCGACLMLIADTIGRVILAPVMIPVGIVISFLGVPIFLNLIVTRKKGYFK